MSSGFHGVRAPPLMVPRSTPQADACAGHDAPRSGDPVGALREAFAATARWLGAERFDATAVRYLDARPPRVEPIDHWGGDFVTWLERAWAADIDVGELAWIDWHRHLAARAPDCDATGVAGLDADDWDAVEIDFVPTLHFRLMRTNAVALWRALSDGVGPPPVQQVPGGIGARVWRRGGRADVASMTADESTCLDLALQGASFGEIRAFLDLTHDEAQTARIVGGCFGAWTAEGMVAALRR